MIREQHGDAQKESLAELHKKNEELQFLLERMTNAKEEWEKTVDCVSDMVILIGQEGRIKRCNKPLRDFIGNSYAEIIGKDWKELLHACGMEELPADEKPAETVHPPSHSWFMVNFYPFQRALGSDGADFGTVITFHNSTDVKISQMKILQQEKMASIGQLAAGVAHEINNPVGFISSNLKTLQKYIEKLMEYTHFLTKTLDSQDKPELAEAVNAAKTRLKFDLISSDISKLIAESLDGVDRVRTIVRDLKTFSHADEQEAQFSDLNACMDATINIVWNELKYKATLKKEYGDLPFVQCYPQQLNQVFMNLLVNAGHAIETQGEVLIKTWAQEGTVRISVTDTGCGISEENRQKIFEPFFTTKDIGKGTGLGLSIAYDIIKSHNGEITVQSEIGKGTTFTVMVPVEPKKA